ncbi:cupin domain-containing protein [Kitasatospora purpeofusca]|uniref:cupin domain-containing protein n=1 Tax=Kitasatospora purpeofusca TaxID=67352 RepID=UPI00225AF027|nr:cupin domain-containing protein [Kitasatospora purpeofusca]MCX4684351.1 cupin domain-containing protein [Kitasatospora purpeofusca]
MNPTAVSPNAVNPNAVSPIDLPAAASALPAPWESRLLEQVGTAAVKVLRMDGRPLPVEVHDSPEVLLVLSGRLELLLDGAELAVGPGELCRIPARAPHAVRPGSRGILLIVEVPEGE